MKSKSDTGGKSLPIDSSRVGYFILSMLNRFRCTSNRSILSLHREIIKTCGAAKPLNNRSIPYHLMPPWDLIVRSIGEVPSDTAETSSGRRVAAGPIVTSKRVSI